MTEHPGPVSRMSLEAANSVVTGDNSNGVLGTKESVRMDQVVATSTCTEWTDEKHSLYLNFIEASFVNQLYNHEYGSMDSLGWFSKNQELLGCKPFQSSANSRFSSGQFKVLRSGCWQKINFKKVLSPQDLDIDSQVLLANPWVQHFRPPFSGKGREVLSQNPQENNHLVKKHGIRSTGGSASSMQSPAIYGSNFFEKNAEVSDQNFVDKVCCLEEDQKHNRCGHKRVKTAADFSSKDQVVPFGISESTGTNLLREGKI